MTLLKTLNAALTKYQLSLLVALLFVSTLFCYWPIINGTYLITWDAYDHVFPQIVFLSDSFHSGVFPMWNPYILSGEAFFAQSAGFAYHPLYLLLATLPANWDLYYFFQLSLIFISFLGGLGVFYFIRDITQHSYAAVFAGIAASAFMFGPILGQPAIACSIAMLPWLLYILRKCISGGAFFSITNAAQFTLTLSLSILSGYFAASLYNITIIFMYLVFLIFDNDNLKNKTSLKNILKYFLFVGIASPMLLSVYLLPAIENRAFYYSGINSGFVSPDPVLRGLNVTSKVDIIRDYSDLPSLFLGMNNTSEPRALWVIGIGYLCVIATLLGILLFYKFKIFKTRQKRHLYFFLFMGIVFLDYCVGTKGYVFNLVSRYIPIYGNIRYPVFGFYTCQFFLITFAAISISFMYSKLEKRKRTLIGAIFLPLLLVDIYVFYDAVGIYQGKASHILEIKSKTYTYEFFNDRKTNISSSIYQRQMSETNTYDYLNKSWLKNKVAFNHGYSTSDSPTYWYFKNLHFLNSIVSFPSTVTPEPQLMEPTFTANQYMERLQNSLKLLKPQEVYTDGADTKTTTKTDSCTLKDFIMLPNEFKINVTSARGCFLSLNDKLYPGWRLKIDGLPGNIVKTNYLFKGAFLPAGDHEALFYFRPISLYAGAGLGFFTLMILIFMMARKNNNEEN